MITALVRSVFVITAVAAFVNGSQAFAQSNCLSRVTDEDLLAEVGRRMGSGGSADLDVVASCHGNMLLIDVANLATGSSQTVTVQTASSIDCRTYSDAVAAKSQRLQSGGRVAACDFHYLTIVTIARSGVATTRQVTTASSTECRAQAEAINR